MEETGQRKRKRARISTSPESGDEGKKRGRPRVEKQDASAADRRRTQIRMAQRAYRQRKESTLEDLRGHVSELTNAAELMNKAFSDCRDRLSATPGIAHVALEDLRQTSLQFDALMKTMRSPEEDLPLEKPPAVQRPSTRSESPDKPPQRSTEIQNVPSWLDQTVVKQAHKRIVPEEVGMGYTMYAPEAGETAQPVDYFNLGQQTQQIAPAQKAQQHSEFDSLDAQMLRIPPSLPPPKTYSFQESSFARRLHRACLEAGYYLLLDPTRRPQTYKRVFRLSLMGREKSKITSALRAMLARGPNESLDFWEAPLIHVGGAGTHYPRRDQFGNPQPRKSSYNLGLVGPQTLALLEDAARNNLSTDMTVEIAGYEGEWFDPYDVQGYLEEKGIHIDPSSSFAEAEIEDTPTTPDSVTTLSSRQSPTTPLADFPIMEPPVSFNVEQQLELNLHDASTDAIKWDDLMSTNFTGVGYSDALTGSWMNFLEPGQGVNGTTTTTTLSPMDWDTAGAAELMQDSAMAALTNSAAFRPAYQPEKVQPRKKSVIVDVAKFIKGK
ncbi:hypothetical protein LTR36_006152 [Oleoguttula mirabilis]|uniref:BZIP domain-containing protein n=1 Tax=Oleoguttula mirabilis TaxID=1507867 RepID=A0AAV9JC39_9PEZI|nr:hypothetical protein LTR36_006152 [Oleoguttula mirabilis]